MKGKLPHTTSGDGTISYHLDVIRAVAGRILTSVSTAQEIHNATWKVDPGVSGWRCRVDASRLPGSRQNGACFRSRLRDA